MKTVDGPDFNVYYFSHQAGEDFDWGVYSGNFAPATGDGPTLTERDGVAVKRASENGKFAGYLAEFGNAQEHFFGSVFDGTDKDKAFFDRIDFSPAARKRCGWES